MRVTESSRPKFPNPVVVAWAAAWFLVGCGASSDEPGATEEVPRGLLLSTPEAAEGYVFYTPLTSSTTYLLESSSGAIVHTWESEYAPAGSVYLLDNGHLLRGGIIPDAEVFSGGGQGGRIQEWTWDGELVWDYAFANEDHLLHHDIEILPNGNVLAIAWEAKSLEAAQEMGRRPEMTPEVGIWPDMVVEFEPQPPNGARIVWEWHSWDHMIQDRDETLSHFGDPSEHPELIDINAGRELSEDVDEDELDSYREIGYVPSDSDFTPSSDIMHLNAIAYNADLDQIALSSPPYNEIWIIDHSTTTEEARGHTGGRWGRGGDLLYRWGNPGNYGRGSEDDQRLFGQHDVRWVPEGMPGAGHILVFNNNNTGPEGIHSAVFELEPLTDGSGEYVMNDDEPFGPPTPTWSYVASDPTSFHSSFISGAHRLAGGHTLITSGAQGRFFEVTSEGEMVWEYWSPTSGDVRSVGGNPYAVFRATKIAPDHPALQGRQLVPLDPQPTPVAPLETSEN